VKTCANFEHSAEYSMLPGAGNRRSTVTLICI